MMLLYHLHLITIITIHQNIDINDQMIDSEMLLMLCCSDCCCVLIGRCCVDNDCFVCSMLVLCNEDALCGLD